MAVGAGPDAIAVDQATHTAYVANANDATVSVVNTATCNALVAAGCGQAPPTVPVGPGPDAVTVDQATDTVYVANAGGDTVSVINGATCSATVTSGCGSVAATITVGPGPAGVGIDQATHTVYVTNSGTDTVSVVNEATCNGTVTTGCALTPPTVTVAGNPWLLAVNQVTDTVYVPEFTASGASSVGVIDGATCNASVTTGCGQTPPTVSLGLNTMPYAAAVDQATDTVYEMAEGPSLGFVYVINGATCNATVTSGCGQVPPTVAVGACA